MRRNAKGTPTPIDEGRSHPRRFASAIIFNQNGMKVVVVENGIAPLHNIGFNADYGIEVEVTSGIKEADQVILQPSMNPAEAIRHRLAPEPRTPHLGRSREFDKQFHSRKDVWRMRWST